MEILYNVGDTSIIDKWSKAEIALKIGVDLVVELPTIYSISSAENFAEGAIKLLSAFGKDVTLSFGSECGDISALTQIANVLCSEPKEYLTILQHELTKGVSYPKARENALMFYLGDVRKYANIPITGIKEEVKKGNLEEKNKWLRLILLPNLLSK